VSKKLEKNGLWESSRMLLPEHKARIQESNHELNRREKPIHDVSKWEEINQRLAAAYHYHEEITLTSFDPFDDQQVKGIIAKVDVVGRRLLINGEWIRFKDILEVI